MKKIWMNADILETMLWNVAIPGIAQLKNGKYIKGFTLLTATIMTNIQANFNQVIMYSVLGEIKQAIEATDYQWLLYFPCLYMFAIWDAYKDSGGGKNPFSFLPMVFATYFVTMGLIFSANFKVFGMLFGPVWLPVLFLWGGIGIGYIIKAILVKAFAK